MPVAQRGYTDLADLAVDTEERMMITIVIIIVNAVLTCARQDAQCFTRINSPNPRRQGTDTNTPVSQLKILRPREVKRLVNITHLGRVAVWLFAQLIPTPSLRGSKAGHLKAWGLNPRVEGGLHKQAFHHCWDMLVQGPISKTHLLAFVSDRDMAGHGIN